MSAADSDELSNLALLDLFRREVEEQAAIITAGLLTLERDPSATGPLEELMRGAHSLKGAAHIVNRESAVRLAHAMEDCFIAAQRGAVALGRKRIDILLRALDLLTRSAQAAETEIDSWQTEHRTEIQTLVSALSSPIAEEEKCAAVRTAPPENSPPQAAPEVPAEARASAPAAAPAIQFRPSEAGGRALRIAPEDFNRLLGLSGETVVASRWLDEFAAKLLRMRKLHDGLTRSIRRLGDSLAHANAAESLQDQAAELRDLAARCRSELVERIESFEHFELRFAGLATRLHQGVLDCRMRPFSDGIRGFRRMVRDVAHGLGKRVKLEILGDSTPVDRDILERLEIPLNHLLRNAIDHGIESPEERRKAGKPEEGTIRLEARHAAGLLFITVADDGRGVDIPKMRQAVVKKKLATADIAEKLTEAELMEFLFLPGFTMKEHVTEISGRGVGLDAVQVMAKNVGGAVRVSYREGQGLNVELRLPLTLSVLRALLVEIAGEPYAFPLARIASVAKTPREKIESVEGREHFTLGAQQVGLVAAQQIFGIDAPPPAADELSVIVLGDEGSQYGVVVDRFIGEGELVVQPLDPRLGGIRDISAAALLPDQSPVLIVDVPGMIHSIGSLAAGHRLTHVRREMGATPATARKRVLVVEDSLTVRELERKLLDGNGYEVDAAVDGMDGWNAVRTGNYDLVVTDVDMPRLDGIELIKLIRKDPRLRSLPVMIVSYKDREEDRRRGLDAGADYYVAKGAFHHDALLEAVADLIGKAHR